MLPKAERFKKEDFKGLKPKNFFRGTYFDISVSPAEKSKFACIISQKRIKKAVDRNRIKRRIYSALEKIKPHSSYLVIIYPKVSSINSNFSNIQEELKKAFATL